MNQTHRNQVADLILTNLNGNDLVVASGIETSDDGSMSFEVMEELETYPKHLSEVERYRVTIKIEEL